MALRVTKVDVWAGEIADQPGGLARVLEALAEGGANLECVIARREQHGTGTVFVSPLSGKRLEGPAAAAGVHPAQGLGTLRVEGRDRPGLGSEITRAVADAGLSMRGASAMVLGGSFVAYLGFDSEQDADAAARALRAVSDAGGGRGASGGGAGGGSRGRATGGTKRKASPRATGGSPGGGGRAKKSGSRARGGRKR